MTTDQAQPPLQKAAPKTSDQTPHTSDKNASRSSNAKKPGKPSPEEIARIRKERQAKRARLAAERKEQHVPEVNAHGFSSAFKKRQLTPIPDVRCSDGSRFTLMSYNILAQTLVRRKLFPTSGEALKWKNRQDVLVNELRYYSPTLMALQEVGKDMLESRLDQFLQDRDYLYEFYCGHGKQHGLVIAYNKTRFELVHSARINYDEAESNQKAKYPSKTNNVGLCCVLREKQNGTVLTVGTTHLFWHPKASNLRAWQIESLRTFVFQVDAQYGHGNVILAGDFNTEPIDPSYKALTQRPFELDEEGQAIAEESSRYKALKDTEGEDEDDSTDVTTQMDNDGSTSWQGVLEKLAIGPQLYSMYGQHYNKIDPDNVQTPSLEPVCTNYAMVYRGTLDYILTRSPGGINDSLQLTALLKMPDTKLLGDGQPQAGEFPSDHFALIAEFGMQNDEKED